MTSWAQKNCILNINKNAKIRSNIVAALNAYFESAKYIFLNTLGNNAPTTQKIASGKHANSRIDEPTVSKCPGSFRQF